MSKLTKENEAKVFILYLMNYAGCGLEYDDIFSLAGECGFMGYFDFSEIFSKLIQENNVRDNGGIYFITGRGQTIAENLGYLVSTDAKNKCAVNTPRLLGLKKLGAESYSKAEPENGGYRVTCGVKGAGREIFSASLFVKEKAEADKMQKIFDERPDYIYRCILGMMTGDADFIL